MIRVKNISRKKLFFLFLIVVISIFVRFYHLDIKMRFIWDEGRDMMAIHRIVADKNITLFGPFNEIDGKKDFFGVFHYYLMAPALFLANYDPIGPAIFTAFLGVISVILVYFLLREWTSEKKALLVSLFYAVSPLVIRYVQWPWNPNTTPFFTFLYFLFLTKIIKNKNKKLIWTIFSGLLLGVLFQLHYFTIPLGIIYLIIFLNNKDKRWHELFLFILFFILPNLTFLIFDLTHDFFYFKILKETFMGESSQRYFSINLFNFFIVPFKYIFDLIFKLFFKNILFTFFLEAILFFSIFKSIKMFFKDKKITLSLMISFAWLVFLLMISFFPGVFNDYHSSYLWFGIFYFLIDFFGQKKIALFSYFLISLLMFKNIDLNREPIWSENMPLVRELSSFVVSDYEGNFEGKKINIASFTDSDTRATKYRYFLQKDNLIVDGIDQYSNSEIIYVISPHLVEKNKDNPAWEISELRDLEWNKIGEKDGIFVYRIVK
jgi:4-amino-4-deoxy-L-arabinose transferase-like glycosyltransferase